MIDQLEQECNDCFGEGWVWDDLSSAMGGTPWKYCHCDYGRLLSDKDDEKYRKKKKDLPMPDKEKLEIMLEALKDIKAYDGQGADLSPPGRCYDIADNALRKMKGGRLI